MLISIMQHWTALSCFYSWLDQRIFRGSWFRMRWHSLLSIFSSHLLWLILALFPLNQVDVWRNRLLCFSLSPQLLSQSEFEFRGTRQRPGRSGLEQDIRHHRLSFISGPRPATHRTGSSESQILFSPLFLCWVYGTCSKILCQCLTIGQFCCIQSPLFCDFPSNSSRSSFRFLCASPPTDSQSSTRFSSHWPDSQRQREASGNIECLSHLFHLSFLLF